MAPGEQARREPLADGTLGHQEFQHCNTKTLLVVAAFGAIDPCEPVVRIAAFEEALDDALFEQPLQASLGAQFRQVAIGALIERARARPARPIHAACGRPARRSLAAS